MIDRARITGLILAGGRGTRMGSVDKGLQPFAGRPLVAHAIERLGPQVGGLIVSANRSIETYASLGIAVLPDRLPDFAGPLAGIDAALAVCPTDFLACAPVDAPFFPLDLVATLAVAVMDDADDVDAAMATTPARPHPVFCLVRRRLAAGLAHHLADGHRSVGGWLGTLRVRAVSFADESAFHNLNDLDTLRAAEADRIR